MRESNFNFDELDWRNDLGPRDRLIVGADFGERRTSPSSSHVDVRRAVMLAVLVFAAAVGALALTRFHGSVASVWFANAVAFGIIIRAPRSEWRVLLIVALFANTAANLASHNLLGAAVTLALISVVETTIVLYAMTHVFARRERFDDSYVIARFILYAGVAAPLCAALLAGGALVILHGSAFATTVLHWYVADALGLLTLGALLLAMREQAAAPREEWLASLAGAILSSVATIIVFTRGSGSWLFAVGPLLMIATLRVSLTGALAALVSCGTIAVTLTLGGVGPLAQDDIDPAIRIYLLQGFIASLLFVVLPVRALIGERDRLGGAFAQSERMLSRFADASPAGTIHFDSMGRPIFVNQRWTELTGFARNAVDEDHWLDAIDPADRSAANSLWSRARATLEPCSREYRFGGRRAAGFAELNIYPEVEDGRVLGFIARLTDVTDRRVAEEALREREKRYRLVTENGHDVIFRLGLDGCPLYASGASLRVTGFAPAELVGKPLSDLIHPHDAPVFTQTLARLAQGSVEGTIEFRLRHRDGHYSWFESSQRPLFDTFGAPTELVASLRNIDSRRQSERVASAAAVRLRDTHRLMLLAEELAGVGSWQIDIRDRALVLSPQINRTLGRECADRLQASEILSVVHDSDRRRLLACLAGVRRRADTCECALRIHAGDGLRHVRLVAKAEHELGAFVGWVGVAHDVSDKVKTEAALIEARDAAQAATLAKSYFLATMSHEIRTPMTGVLGMIDLLRDDPPPRERKRYFGALAQSATMLMSVLDAVLDFSKIDSGALRLEQSDFDIEVLATSTIELFGNAASRKGLRIAFESSCTVPATVRGDAVRVQQILSNLLSNAVKFTERGEIKLRMSCQPASASSMRYQLQVADTGIGLDAGQIERLFDPFVQADASTSRRFGGTGLGLSISRRLVELMGGTLDVTSRLGEGSTFAFDITLPIGQVVNPIVGVSDSRAQTPLDVLVAEDNPITQMLVAALVRRMGHRVTVVKDGREAVTKASAVRFDAILMDMQMPELDGLAATRAIRASGGPSASTPILALTADASAERRRFYDGAGLTDFLTKPIDRPALAERLAAIGQPTAVTAPPTMASSTELLEVARVDELRSALGDARFDALLALLVAECRERPTLLSTAHRRGDLAALQAEAHTIKGAAGNIGASALGLAALRIEQACDLATAKSLIAEFGAVARATQVAAERLMSPTPIDRASA